MRIMMKQTNIFYPCLLFALSMLVNGCNPKQEKTEKANTPPFIKSVAVLPEVPVLNSRVILRIDAGDKEGDRIDYAVKWYKNGAVIGEGLEFFLDDAKRGDKLFAEVIPSDSQLAGETIRSNVVTIGNTPPAVVGARISPDTILTSTSELTVIGEGIDPDNDSIRWVCYWAVNNKGRVADSSTTIKLKVLKLKKGDKLTAELYAYDSDTVSLPYLLTIDVVNSPPVLKGGMDSIPYHPDSIYYRVPIIDPEGDAITFQLLESPPGLIIDRKTGIVHGTVAESTAFEILVRATDSDGAQMEASFTLTPP